MDRKINRVGEAIVASALMKLSLISLLIWAGILYFLDPIASILYSGKYCGKMGCTLELLTYWIFGVAISVISLYFSSIAYLFFS